MKGFYIARIVRCLSVDSLHHSLCSPGRRLSRFINSLYDDALTNRRRLRSYNCIGNICLKGNLGSRSIILTSAAGIDFSSKPGITSPVHRVCIGTAIRAFAIAHDMSILFLFISNVVLALNMLA